MLFFQAVLCLGYLYTGRVASMSLRTQRTIHIVMLAAAALTLPIVPPETWRPLQMQNPSGYLLLLLILFLGLPYLVLSANSPYIQTLFVKAYPSRSPYPLFAVSNLASFLSLLSYPFLFEPLVGLAALARVWALLFLLFVLLSAWCLFRIDVESRNSSEVSAADRSSVVAWLLFAAAGTAVMLTTTDQICHFFAAVPLLYIVPLSLYLLTFVIVFSRFGLYSRRWSLVLLAVSLLAGTLTVEEQAVHSGLLLVLACLVQFFACLLCHGELAKLAPPSGQLSRYYVAMAAGGALGGMAVAIGAPLLFSSFGDYPLSIEFCLLLVAVQLMKRDGMFEGRLRLFGYATICAASVLAVVATERFLQLPGISVRNFFGIVGVRELSGNSPQERQIAMYHGSVMHGSQFLSPEKRHVKTSYYGEQSAAHLVFDTFKAGEPRRVGLVGLGAGSLAAYGKPADEFRFYEINPAVVTLARQHFTFLSDSEAKVEVIEGDARTILESEQPQHFDILVLDAYSGGVIPVHLLSEEAFALYLRHLADGGVLLLHISSRFVDLVPVVNAAAVRFGMEKLLMVSDGNTRDSTTPALYAVLTHNRKFVEDPRISGRANYSGTQFLCRWTDDYSSLLPLMKW